MQEIIGSADDQDEQLISGRILNPVAVARKFKQKTVSQKDIQSYR